jgi:predicted kinase
VIRWPPRGRPTAAELARRIDAFCRERDVAAVSIDGPQGWRDPALAEGWGRTADREARTPGRLGPPRTCVPGTYIGWVTTSVEVFAALAALPHVRLVNAPVERIDAPPPGSYHLLESFPTSTWRTARLRPLPAKSKTADTAPYAEELARTFGLPALAPLSHDDLQAVVAALPAAALLGGPVAAVPRGEPGRRAGDEFVEGLIWDAVPAARPAVDASAPALVVVTGPPASGKTTLAEALARELGLPLVAKDAIKERLFDAFGTGDRAWSHALGRAAFEVLFGRVEAELRAGRSVVAEANFETASAGVSFGRLPPARIVQLHCSAPLDVLLERYRARERHPGHLDRQLLEEVREAVVTGRHGPLPLPGERIELDTTAELDFGAIAERVRAHL